MEDIIPKRSPEEIVDDMMSCMHVPILQKALDMAVPHMPKHHIEACIIAEGLTRRAKCAETFKTWGSPEQIAAKMFNARLPKPSPALRGAPSRFFPSQPVLQSQLSSDVR